MLCVMVGPLCLCCQLRVGTGSVVCNDWSTVCLCCLMRVGMGGVVGSGWSTVFVLSDTCRNGRCCV